MIPANELRVGNKVQYGKGFIFDVVSIHDDGTVYCDFDGNEGDVWEFNDKNPCEPVPLTEEILLKCEGHELMAEGVIEYNRFTLTYMPAYKYWDVTTIDAYVTKVEYLHEWQNVVFALNNHELNIKL